MPFSMKSQLRIKGLIIQGEECGCVLKDKGSTNIQVLYFHFRSSFFTLRNAQRFFIIPAQQTYFTFITFSSTLNKLCWQPIANAVGCKYSELLCVQIRDTPCLQISFLPSPIAPSTGIMLFVSKQS